jgi:hypothetical protein
LTSKTGHQRTRPKEGELLMPAEKKHTTVRRPAASVGVGDRALVYSERGGVPAKVKGVQREGAAGVRAVARSADATCRRPLTSRS